MLSAFFLISASSAGRVFPIPNTGKFEFLGRTFMSKYVDVYLLPILEDKIPAYREMAE